jgi:hypothetical protein
MLKRGIVTATGAPLTLKRDSLNLVTRFKLQMNILYHELFEGQQSAADCVGPTGPKIKFPVQF